MLRHVRALSQQRSWRDNYKDTPCHSYLGRPRHRSAAARISCDLSQRPSSAPCARPAMVGCAAADIHRPIITRSGTQHVHTTQHNTTELSTAHHDMPNGNKCSMTRNNTKNPRGTNKQCPVQKCIWQHHAMRRRQQTVIVREEKIKTWIKVKKFIAVKATEHNYARPESYVSYTPNAYMLTQHR